MIFSFLRYFSIVEEYFLSLRENKKKNYRIINKERNWSL